MQQLHHPVVEKKPEGRWIVSCPECEYERGPLPVGIDIPVNTLRMAELLRDNHAEMP